MRFSASPFFGGSWFFKMSYFLASDPLPQTSLTPPPNDGSAVRRGQMADYSRTGRERVYANLPTVDDLAQISIPLAIHAQGMITASEVARQKVLNGLGDNIGLSLLQTLQQDIQSIIANAPQVLSLNGSRQIAPALANSSKAPQGGQNVYPVMPDRAPIPVNGVGYITPRYMSSPVPSKPLSQKQAGPPQGCGLSGFSPAWGDAYVAAAPMQPASPKSTVSGWWLLAGVVGLGYLAGRKGRR